MTKTPPVADRELRSQGRRTMARLLDAGMAVLSDRGYHAARVDDIVAAADVSHGTFYLYFSNKEELLKALAERCAEEMAGVVGALGEVEPGPEGLDVVRAWLADFVTTYRRYGVVIRAWMEDTLSDNDLVELGEKTFGDVSGILIERLRAASAPNVDNPQLASVALLALYERYTYFLVSRGSVADEEATLDTMARLIHRGWFAGRVAA